MSEEPDNSVESQGEVAPQIFITSEEVDGIFKEIEKFPVTLMSDPSTAGSSYLLEITALVRGRTNRVTVILNRMTQRRLEILRSLNALKVLYKQTSNHLLSTDPLVRAQKSIKDREAYIAIILADQARAISSLEAQLHEVETVIETLKLSHRELRDVAGEIRSQSKIIEIELKTKSFYGDEFERPRNAEERAKQESQDQEIEDFLAGEGL